MLNVAFKTHWNTTTFKCHWLGKKYWHLLFNTQVSVTRSPLIRVLIFKIRIREQQPEHVFNSRGSRKHILKTQKIKQKKFQMKRADHRCLELSQWRLNPSGLSKYTFFGLWTSSIHLPLKLELCIFHPDIRYWSAVPVYRLCLPLQVSFRLMSYSFALSTDNS